MLLLDPDEQALSVVLDWWHADERLSVMSAIAYGTGSHAAKKWREKTRTLLWDGELDEFFATLEQRMNGAATRQNPELVIQLKAHYDYFAARRGQLRYKECRELGLPVGSGAIEGGIRFVGKDRLNRTGMRWNVAGGELMLQLRCIKCGNRWEEMAKKRELTRRQKHLRLEARWLQAA